MASKARRYLTAPGEDGPLRHAEELGSPGSIGPVQGSGEEGVDEDYFNIPIEWGLYAQKLPGVIPAPSRTMTISTQEPSSMPQDASSSRRPSTSRRTQEQARPEGGLAQLAAADTLTALNAHHQKLKTWLNSWMQQQDVIVGELCAPLGEAVQQVGNGSLDVQHSEVEGLRMCSDPVSQRFRSNSTDRQSFTGVAEGCFSYELDPEAYSPIQGAEELHGAVENEHEKFQLHKWNEIIDRTGAEALDSVVRHSAELLRVHRDANGRRQSVVLTERNLHDAGPLSRMFIIAYEMFSSPAPKAETRFGRCVQSRAFELLSCVVILTNSAFLAYTTDYAREHPEEPTTKAMDIIDLFFCILYSAELISRITVSGMRYFVCVDWSWNLFDTMLVLLSVYEQFHALFNSTSTAQNVTSLRALRLMKMLKIMRIVRVLKTFKELRLITACILGSIRAMQWSLVLVFALTFLASLIFTQATTTFLQENRLVDVPEEMELYWGSVGTSMQSLYMAVTGGNDWMIIAAPLKELDGPYYGLFYLYTAFYMWVLCNTLTSVFVETTMRSALTDQQQIIQDQLENKEQYVHMLMDWYTKLKKDDSGEIKYEDFCRALQDPAMYAFAQSMDIDVSDVKQFFTALSAGGSRAVDLDTFVVGCIKLKGAAKSIDLMDLIYTHRQAIVDQKRFAEFTAQQFAWLRKRVGVGIGTSFTPNHSAWGRGNVATNSQTL